MFTRAVASNYSNVLWLSDSAAALYAEAGLPTTATGEPIAVGGRLAVAELGSYAPRDFWLDGMRRGKQFASVHWVTGGRPPRPPKLAPLRATTQEVEKAARQRIQNEVEDLRLALATVCAAGREQGCEYVLAIVSYNSGRWTKAYVPWLDLFLFFPLFVLPDQRVDAHGIAVAWLMDTRDGRILRYERVEAHSTRLATFASCDNAVKLAMDAVDPKLAEQLARRLTVQTRENR